MKITPLLLSIILISSNNSFAADSAIALSKGEIAPFTGILMPLDLAKTVNNKLTDCNRIKLINQSLNDSINIYKKNEVLYKSEVTEIQVENLSLRTAVDNANKNNFWRNALYFGLGVLTTSAVVYATRQH